MEPTSVLGPGFDVVAFDGGNAGEDIWEKLMKKWSRPKMATDPGNLLAVFLVDIDSSNAVPPGDLLHRFKPPLTSPPPEVPVIRLFGVTSSGSAVLLHVLGFYPYLYCEAGHGRGEAQLKDNAVELREKLNNCLQGNRISGSPVVDVSIVYKESLTDFKPCEETYPSSPSETSSGLCLSPYFMVSLQMTKHVGICRNYLQNSGDNLMDSTGDRLLGGCGVFEGSIPIELRYMVDNDITGCAWVEVDRTKCLMRGSGRCESSGQFEADVFYEDIIAHQPEAEWQAIPSIRLLSFDIECVKMQGCGFPVAQEDPVIQISSVMQTHGSPDLYFKTIFALDECAPIAGAHVFWFRKEEDLLQKWSELIRRTDPDILTGYNCINFDMFYLLTRAETLGLQGFDRLSRLVNSHSKVSTSVLSSKAMGTHENKQINIEGRIQLDVMDAVRRDHKLKSYTLNNVSFAFLREQKEDVHYSSIRDLQCGTPETRRRIAVYCIKDSYLPLRLIDKLLIIYNYVEMARVTGCPIALLLTRGQQIRVTSQLLRQAKPLNYIVPSKPRLQGGDSSEQYTGATVLDPMKGFYQKPIATLDFASLYPSIIMAHNLCYTTLVQPHLRHKLRPEDVTETTTSPKYYFVKPHVRKGVLPMILQNLLGARKKAKAQMATEADPFKKNVYNGRQLALKISANSVYGFTGATTGGQLPCLEIATSTTCYGRDMIELTKNYVQSRYCIANGYSYNAVVIYGDTDSVMVDFTNNRRTTDGGAETAAAARDDATAAAAVTNGKSGGEEGLTKAEIVARRLPLSVEEIMNMGRNAADWISQQFISPIKLEFEKVYFPFLLMNKKRYAGLIYTKPGKHDRKDCKGIETVRRDFCPLVQRLVDSVLDKMLIDFDVVGAQQLTKDTIADLLQNKVDMSLLVVTKSIGKVDYEMHLPHVELAKKLRQRDPGTAPGVGDRVSYIVIKGHKGQPQYDRAEDPLYALDNNLTIDTNHYLENIKNPIMRVFEGVMPNPDTLFSGDHTRVKTLMSSNSNPLMSVSARVRTCAGGHAVCIRVSCINCLNVLAVKRS
eukprot:GHVS01056366.1.p1 GENE.GHVS01056366.1~~GHVS01056366.1.p1  ORF type:complete len:1060 (+),score=107.39 GHVS01056366.1:163-3342(+)